MSTRNPSMSVVTTARRSVVKKFLQENIVTTLFGKSVHPDDHDEFFDALDKYPDKRIKSDMQLLKLLIASVQALQTIPAIMFPGICRFAKRKHIKRKELVVKQGDVASEAFIVIKGKIDVEIGPERKVVFTFKPGDFFGDYGLQNEDARRTADCRARTDVDVLIIPRQIYIKYMMQHMHGNRELKKLFFSKKIKYSFFETKPDITDKDFTEQMNWMACKSYKKGDTIALQGHPSKKLYWVVSGAVNALRTVFVQGQPIIFEVGKYRKGFSFGCNFTSINEVNSHTWVCDMNTTIYSISRGDFQRKFKMNAVKNYKQTTNILRCTDSDLRSALKNQKRWQKYKNQLIQGMELGTEPDWFNMPEFLKKNDIATEIATGSLLRCGIALKEF